MKIRAVMAGLVLLMLIVCPISQSHAAKSLRHNIHNNPVVDEHPWQESGAPFDDQSIVPFKAGSVIIVIGPVKFARIGNPFRIELMPMANRDQGDFSRGEGSQ